MKIQPGCHRCIEHQLKLLSNEIGKGDASRMSLILNELLAIYSGVVDSASPPELAALYYEYFERKTGISDPFRREKKYSTELALRLLPELRKLVDEAGEGAFERAMLFAIGGNIIDYGVNPDFDIGTAERQILQVLDYEYDRDAAAELRCRMDGARSIMYIMDNCGEAVIDRLLIERYSDKITVVVRGRPILNDVTRDDAVASGLDFVPIIDNGDGAPGVSLRRSSSEFLRQLRATDLVIAKGQGNFEAMGDEFHDRPAFYLLRTKCDVICGQLGAKLNSIQIIGRNLRNVPEHPVR